MKDRLNAADAFLVHGESLAAAFDMYGACEEGSISSGDDFPTSLESLGTMIEALDGALRVNPTAYESIRAASDELLGGLNANLEYMDN